VGDVFYNNLGDPLNASRNVVQSPLRANLVGMTTFYADLAGEQLPAVSYVVPANLDAGHPGNSAPAYYENFVRQLVADVQAHPSVWASTAIVVTTDEGGGFFDTGHIQQLDFFGDGPRIPLFVVSPYAKKGYVDHVYHDHASVLKFIERNWGLAPLSSRSRDRLPNPVASVPDPYLPANAPAIGDLSSLFAF
jgi:phospholipase C